MAILGETFENRNIQSFRDRMLGGGARPNMFEVNIDLPDQIGKDKNRDENMRFMIKAAEIPAANIGNIPVPFRGRVLLLQGIVHLILGQLRSSMMHHLTSEESWKSGVI